MSNQIAKSIDPRKARDLLGLLTPAQVEVMDRVLLHKTSKEIARDLGIAPNTVDQRVKAVWRKLGTDDRASTARLYGELKAICGQTTYGSAVIDQSDFLDNFDTQDLPVDPEFKVEDSATFPSQSWVDRSKGLEAFDAKFGKFGRVVMIFLCAVLVAIVGLIVTSVAVTLGDLI